MKKFLVLRGHGSEHYDASPYLLLEVDDELRKRVLDRADDAAMLKEKHGSDFHSLELFDYDGEWFDLYSLDDDLEGIEDFQVQMDDDGSLELAEDHPVLKHILEKVVTTRHEGGAHIRSECNIMVVTSDQVYFKMYPKHTDFRVESAGITFDYLRGEE